jgi:ferrochelatase
VAGLATPTVQVCCYPDQDGFIKASADQVRIAYNTLVQEYPHTRPPRVLFSAHGLPEKIIRRGDPYQAQCEKTSALIAEATDIPNLDWQICYQTRVGPLKWIGPSTRGLGTRGPRSCTGGYLPTSLCVGTCGDVG